MIFNFPFPFHRMRSLRNPIIFQVVNGKEKKFTFFLPSFSPLGRLILQLHYLLMVSNLALCTHILLAPIFSYPLDERLFGKVFVFVFLTLFIVLNIFCSTMAPFSCFRCNFYSQYFVCF